ncbi:hypothetical protein NP233_g6149 [Leucocoprinus birnbaumii]|uniref:Uncharacterized protein n=1 Tax=Leucocoprinus birnbaumii TaxID=56174 RepID=A0AAD5YR73_9AGAR|nr:hypothetical protein NP233_g6149 [Leucocoprinus birnbaumii]
MGIPKFFRFISERYPLVSQLIEENMIPEFDNLYIDFNGIIHQCSQSSTDDVDCHISEEQIFSSIFRYVDFLFNKIRPKQLLYVAVDGVAPRAKMNQQRSRRFCAAKKAADMKKRAKKEGRALPDEPFDSNCVTPGTPFMARLSERLGYYLNMKITHDVYWRDIEVILSGSEVPGEGEHKIMDYIRCSRLQPDYNPNTRHCLYGLDANLIMLGLSSHEPHFCLLREGVNFGPGLKKTRSRSLESGSFYLLHLSLMREYLDIEFRSVEPQLPFDYSLENVIDDFILLSVFVGNDFLPDLPGFHIGQNGLEILLDIYKRLLPTLDQNAFEKEYAYLKGLNRRKAKQLDKPLEIIYASNADLTISARNILDEVKAFAFSNQAVPSSLTMPNVFSTRERRFMGKLAKELDLEVKWGGYGENGDSVVVWNRRGVSEDDDIADLSPVAQSPKNDWEDDSDTADDENSGQHGFEAQYDSSVKEKLDEWKKKYYTEKLRISSKKPEKIREAVYRYIEGVLWVMQYYYGGVPSWTWYYDYHYAPRVSDLRGISNMQFEFNLGKPFTPFQQLMAVLPPASMEHVPPAYRSLMTGPNSPIQDFYPTRFQIDSNGRKRDWEAISRIPFVDEKRLIDALKSREILLSSEEKKRNILSTPMKYRYSTQAATVFPSPIYKLPPIQRYRCNAVPLILPTSQYPTKSVLCDGVLLGTHAPAGFPSLKSIPHSATLGAHNLNVYGPEFHVQRSTNKSVLLKIDNGFGGLATEELADYFIGERVFIGWPFLWEALVCAVSDSSTRYFKGPSSRRLISTKHGMRDAHEWQRTTQRLEWIQVNRHGMLIGQIDVLLHVRPLIGLTVSESGESVKQYGVGAKSIDCPIQLCLRTVISEDPRFAVKDRVSSATSSFQKDSPFFFLEESAYGTLGYVLAINKSSLSVRIECSTSGKSDINRLKRIAKTQTSPKYLPSYKVSALLRISPLALSKITSSFPVTIMPNQEKVNIGLDMKFERKGLMVAGYTRKDGRHWEYSDKAIELLQAYKAKFPDVFENLDSFGNFGDNIPLASEVFNSDGPEKRLEETRKWLESRGVHQFEQAPLSYKSLTKEVVHALEHELDSIVSSPSPLSLRNILIDEYPSPRILKPEHASHRLRNQVFELGDRVIIVKDSGSVPIAAKGVVVGHDDNLLDILWDEPLVLGTTLDGRCSELRGMTVERESCLNLTNPQYTVSSSPVHMRHSGPSAPTQSQGVITGFSAFASRSQRLQTMISVPRASAPPLVTPGLSTGRGRGRGFNAQQAVPMSPVGRGGPSSTSPISDTSDEWRTQLVRDTATILDHIALIGPVIIGPREKLMYFQCKRNDENKVAGRYTILWQMSRAITSFEIKTLNQYHSYGPSFTITSSKESQASIQSMALCYPVPESTLSRSPPTSSVIITFSHQRNEGTGTLFDARSARIKPLLDNEVIFWTLSRMSTGMRGGGFAVLAEVVKEDKVSKLSRKRGSLHKRQTRISRSVNRRRQMGRIKRDYSRCCMSVQASLVIDRCEELRFTNVVSTPPPSTLKTLTAISMPSFPIPSPQSQKSCSRALIHSGNFAVLQGLFTWSLVYPMKTSQQGLFTVLKTAPRFVRPQAACRLKSNNSSSSPLQQHETRFPTLFPFLGQSAHPSSQARVFTNPRNPPPTLSTYRAFATVPVIKSHRDQIPDSPLPLRVFKGCYWFLRSRRKYQTYSHPNARRDIHGC